MKIKSKQSSSLLNLESKREIQMIASCMPMLLHAACMRQAAWSMLLIYKEKKVYVYMWVRRICLCFHNAVRSSRASQCYLEPPLQCNGLHSHALSLSLSCTYAHTHTRTLSLSHTHTHAHTLSLSASISLTHTHTHTHMHIHTHTHAHTHTHKFVHIHTRKRAHMREIHIHALRQAQTETNTGTLTGIQPGVDKHNCANEKCRW